MAPAQTFDVFLSHSSRDKAIVREVKAELERCGVRCWLDEEQLKFGDKLIGGLQAGITASKCVLLFWSGQSRESEWVEDEWTAVFHHQRIIPVLLDDSELPLFLRGRVAIDVRSNRLEALAKLAAQLDAKLPGSATPADVTVTAALPHFTARAAEMEVLRERLRHPGALVPIMGMPGLGKTWLAREFARRHGALFSRVIEVDCEGKPLADLTGALGTKIGVAFEGGPEEVAAQQRAWLGRERNLLVLDNVDDEVPGALVPGENASVLLTSRHSSIGFFEEHKALRPEVFADEEAHALFGSIHPRPYDRAQASALFTRLGHLPLGIAVAAGVLARDPGYTLGGLVNELPPLHDLKFANKNLGDWFGKVINRLDERTRALLQAMACCAPGGWDIGLVREVAQQTEAQSLPGLRVLLDRSLVEVLEWPHRFRLHALVRLAAAPNVHLRQHHAETILSTLERLYPRPPEAARYIEEAVEALATTGIANETASRLANWAGLTASNVGRLPEAMALLQKQERISEHLGDRAGLQRSYGNQALILQAWGRLDDAMALHKKEELICEELGDRAGLQASYGNQAIILQSWGRLDDAIALHKKKERICEELGDRAGLQSSYGNQAIILKAWGRLDDAMALLQKTERIGEELDDRAGLQRCYGNQANILQSWGRLDDAMALYKKKERICEELGDRAGLQVTYGNQANVLHAWGRLDDAMALHKKQELICEDLGDCAGLQRSYGNQAIILQAWGRLDDAMTLLKKQELICEDLGDRAGLQVSYGNQAVILKAWGRLDDAMALLKKQERICEDLGDRAGLQQSYGNQAIILQAWGRLDDAMALLKNQEFICVELGDRAGIQRSYGNQAIILQAWGRLDDAMALLKKKELICEELGDRRGKAMSLEGQGLVRLATGERDGAQRLVSAALTVYRELRLQPDIDRAERNLGRCEEPPDT